MPIWLIVLLAIYVLGFTGFMIAIFREAPKHGTRVGGLHVLVAAIWPVWGLWYSWIFVSDKVRRAK